MAGISFGDAGTDGRIPKGFLKDDFEEVVPIEVARDVFLVRTVRRKHSLPAPFPCGPGIFPASADGSLT